MRHTVSWAGTPEDEPDVPLAPQAAASPVSAMAARMATAALIGLTACSLSRRRRRAAGGAGLEPAHGEPRAGVLAPNDTSSAPLGPWGIRKLTRKFPIR